LRISSDPPPVRAKPHREVLADGKAGEDLPPLGYVDDACLGNAMRRPARHVLPGHEDLARLGSNEPGDRAEDGRLAGAVRTE
jgi:hypothetical protein